MIVSVMNPTKTAGAVYRISGDSIAALTVTGSTTNPYTEYSDEIINFVRLGDNNMFWYTGDAPFISNIPMSQVNAGATGQVESVGLSGNKAVLLWGNKIVYLKMIGDD